MTTFAQTFTKERFPFVRSLPRGPWHRTEFIDTDDTRTECELVLPAEYSEIMPEDDENVFDIFFDLGDHIRCGDCFEVHVFELEPIGTSVIPAADPINDADVERLSYVLPSETTKITREEGERLMRYLDGSYVEVPGPKRQRSFGPFRLIEWDSIEREADVTFGPFYFRVDYERPYAERTFTIGVGKRVLFVTIR